MAATTSSPIIARFVAEATSNTERIVACVREHVDAGLFEVFVDGGLLGDGRESAETDNLIEALEIAMEQVRAALLGE